MQAALRNKGVARQVTVPVSAGLLADTAGYFEALTAYRGGEAEPIVRCFAQASVAATANGRELVADLRAIRRRWHGAITARSDSAAWRVADLPIGQPVVNAVLVAREPGIESTNAHRYLNPLAAAGILVETAGGRRNRVWRCSEVLGALDDFPGRAVRRV